jgi:RNA polymerase sigma factor (sigma-70 family)
VTPGTTTGYLQDCLNRFRAGDQSARDDLLRHSQDRLRILTRRMLSRFPGVRRFEETDDVLNKALFRISRMLDDVQVLTVNDYFRLAALNIRRELIDLKRQLYGPAGFGAKHATPPAHAREHEFPNEPAAESTADFLSLDDWTAFHEAVAKLPGDEREVYDLHFYNGLPQDEAAEALGISLSTLKRRWVSGRLRIMEWLDSGSTP